MGMGFALRRLIRQNEKERKDREKDPKRDAEYPDSSLFHKDAEDSVAVGQRKRNLSKYGITLEDYQIMFDSQKGKCWICGDKPGIGRNLCVDHDHYTGKVRGLLCHSCNYRLAGIEGLSPKYILKAIKYLKFYKKKGFYE